MWNIDARISIYRVFIVIWREISLNIRPWYIGHMKYLLCRQPTLWLISIHNYITVCHSRSLPSWIWITGLGHIYIDTKIIEQKLTTYQYISIGCETLSTVHIIIANDIYCNVIFPLHFSKKKINKHEMEIDMIRTIWIVILCLWRLLLIHFVILRLLRRLLCLLLLLKKIRKLVIEQNCAQEIYELIKFVININTTKSFGQKKCAIKFCTIFLNLISNISFCFQFQWLITLWRLFSLPTNLRIDLNNCCWLLSDSKIKIRNYWTFMWNDVLLKM